jgi:uncharacterized SAM-binding protein YcdF (DUF218 family)
MGWYFMRKAHCSLYQSAFRITKAEFVLTHQAGWVCGRIRDNRYREEICVFFLLSKIVWFIAGPTNALISLSLLGVILGFTRWSSAGRALAALGVFGLFVLGATPISRVMIGTLEGHYPPNRVTGHNVTGIIVLGGAVGFTHGQIKLTDAASRMTTTYALAREYPDAKVVFTGGDPHIVFDVKGSEADAAKTLFLSLGLEGSRLNFENRSRNTHENATMTAALIKPKPGERWLLVTSAYHMARALGCFEAAGFDVIPYPVDYHTEGDSADYLHPYRAWSAGLATADLAAKEWLGLVAYRAFGYTTQFFPESLDRSGT